MVFENIPIGHAHAFVEYQPYIPINYYYYSLPNVGVRSESYFINLRLTKNKLIFFIGILLLTAISAIILGLIPIYISNK